MEVEDYCRRTLLANGYDWVFSPHIGRVDMLWETSGHLGFYKENMYAPMDIDGEEYSAEADELPVPHRDLPEPDPLATATCRSGSPSTAPATATSEAACCTA